MEDAGRRYPSSFNAQSCPFCDDWSDALQKKKNPKAQDAETQKISVSAGRFKRHVGAHLEQLAMFVLPRVTKDENGNEQSPVNNLGSSVDDLSEPGAQEESRISTEEWLLIDGEDLPNTHEEQDDGLSLTGRYARESPYPNNVNLSVNRSSDFDVAHDETPPFQSAIRAVQTFNQAQSTDNEDSPKSDGEQDSDNSLPEQDAENIDHPKSIQAKAPTNPMLIPPSNVSSEEVHFRTR